MIPALLCLLPLLTQASSPQRALARSGFPPCAPGNPTAPAYSGAIDLASQVDCNALDAGPWSARLAPNGTDLFVTLSGRAGTFGQENCRVARLNAVSGAVSGSFSVGLFPEEIVWTTAGGQIVNGFVSDSSSGTVTVFDANSQVIETIALPDPFEFGSCFPFGLAVSADQGRVFVGTLDGSGAIYVIDTAALAVVDALDVPGGHGRLAIHGRTLIVPTTEYDPFFTSSVAKVVFIEPDDPDGAVAVPIPSVSTFPSAQDVAVRCDGRVFLAGLALGAKVHVLDARTRSYVGAIPAATAGGLQQGLALSSQGLLAVADYASEELAFFDAWTEQWLAAVDLAALPDFHADPEELVFSTDGKKLWAVCNGSDSVAVFTVP